MFNLRFALVLFVSAVSALSSGCSSSAKYLESIEYTSFDKLDRLTDHKIVYAGKTIVIDKVTTQPIKETPTDFDDFVWVLNTGHNSDPRDLYDSSGRPKRYQFFYQAIPINDYEDFFKNAASKHLQADGDSQLHISIDVKKITLITWDFGRNKYRACKIIIGIKSRETEVVASSEIKMPDSYVTFAKSSTFSKSFFKLDPKGLDVIELAFVDALQQAFPQLER